MIESTCGLMTEKIYQAGLLSLFSGRFKGHVCGAVKSGAGDVLGLSRRGQSPLESGPVTITCDLCQTTEFTCALCLSDLPSCFTAMALTAGLGWCTPNTSVPLESGRTWRKEQRVPHWINHSTKLRNNFPSEERYTVNYIHSTQLFIYTCLYLMP